MVIFQGSPVTPAMSRTGNEIGKNLSVGNARDGLGILVCIR